MSSQAGNDSKAAAAECLQVLYDEFSLAVVHKAVIPEQVTVIESTQVVNVDLPSL